ncbi:MAG TPA: helix-turn-helix transcriptional regulator [Nitrososphaera sp.]|jgi:transcriptional regulator with XRE-family HTH domain
MAVAHGSALRRLREKMNITREDIVRHAQVSLGTIRSAEHGNVITYRKAMQILRGLNYCLRRLRQPEVTSVEELGLNIRDTDLEPFRVVSPVEAAS